MNVAAKIALWADRLRDVSAQGLRFAENNVDKTRYRAIQDTAMEGTHLPPVNPLRSWSHYEPPCFPGIRR